MYSRQKAFLIRTAYFAALALLIWGAVRYLLGWVLPFLIALALAAAAEPAIEFCRRKMRFKRAFTAAVLTLALLSALTAQYYLPRALLPHEILPPFEKNRRSPG